MMLAVTRVATAVLLMAGSVAFAQTDSKVESSRAAVSPDGKRTVVIDRFTPVVDGEAERFSGRMLVRVTSNDGSPAKQRYIEASQVRVIQPPVWIDGSRVCAFVYNVAKNSNGIVYFEPETNRALQVEFVMPARQMAASGQVEQELTSLEVSEFTAQGTLKITNVPWKGGSAFPLVLPPLPAFDGTPYGKEFLAQLDGALAAYKNFARQNSVESLEPEQASESFNSNESWLGLLACGGADSFLLGIPLRPGTAADTLAAAKLVKVPGLTLSCKHQTAGEGHAEMVEEGRFLTEWKSDTSLQVTRETYDVQTDAPILTPVLTLNVQTGAVQDHATTATKAAPPAVTLPSGT